MHGGGWKHVIVVKMTCGSLNSTNWGKSMSILWLSFKYKVCVCERGVHRLLHRKENTWIRCEPTLPFLVVTFPGRIIEENLPPPAVDVLKVIAFNLVESAVFFCLSSSPKVLRFFLATAWECCGFFSSYLPESCGFFYPLSLSPAVFSSHCLGVLWFLFSHSTKVLRFLWDTIQQLSHIFSFCGVLWSHRK